MVSRVLVVTIAALSLATPAVAITGGALDDDAHPAVGLMLADRGHGPEPACSGTLISPTVFLTAAHCFEAVSSTSVWVTFDSQVSSSSLLRTGIGYPDAGFDPAARDTHDIGVVVLDEPVQDVAPAALPALDVLRTPPPTLVAVGYGYSARLTGGGKPRWSYDGARRFVTVPVTSVSATTVATSIRDGGTCFGDSGGPHLLGATVVAVTSSGDGKCKKDATAYRTDTSSARTFLAQFVALP